MTGKADEAGGGSQRGWEYDLFIPDQFWDRDLDAYVLADGSAFDDLPDLMNEYGRRGWELVAVTDRPNAVTEGRSKIVLGELTLFFKRPI